MKKRYLLIGTLGLSFFAARAQQADSLFKKQTLDKTEIELLYSYYTQDGNNSAVTGGTGTEKLTVHAPGFRIKSTFDGRHTFSLKAGTDFITSASTDNINYVKSSASLHDRRVFAQGGYACQFKKQDITLSAGAGFSLESDYFSVPVNLGIHFTEKNKMRSYYAEMQFYFDDLRWGRLNAKYQKPVRLIYPVELRFKEWFDEYLRNSFNFRFGFSQVINKRNIIGIYPEFHYQAGLLATPFHRVYFNNGTLKVENLPRQRFKGILGVKANSFIGGRTILKNGLGLYADNWGILAITIENETAIKLNSQFTLSPFIRLYFQQGARYFAPYAAHDPTASFYTSDYDLSSFGSYSGGLGFRYAPYKHSGKKYIFNDVQIRYAFIYRSNNLVSHMLSCSLNMAFLHIKKKKDDHLKLK